MKKFVYTLIVFGSLASLAQAEVIEKMQVKGNQRLEAETIYSYLPFAVGDDVDTDAVNEAIKELYKTGFFNDVKIDLKGSSVVIDVDERPAISSITFEGNDKADTDVLKGEVQIKVRDIYVPTKVQSDVERIKMIYQRMGLLNAKVEAVTENKRRNRVEIIFKISEGDKNYIEDISFVGNNAFSSSDLREQMMSKTKRWYRFFASTDTFDPDRLNYDKELLRRYYFQKGYIDFTIVDTQVSQNAEGNFIVKMTLNEGKRYRLGNIEIKSSLTGLDKKKLLKQMGLKR